MSETETLPSEWTTQHDDEYAFPFVEDENGNVTGYGHQDRAAFAAAINEYDAVCGLDVPEDERWTDEHIGHTWVTFDADRETLHPSQEGAPGAIPVTTLWGQR